MEWIQILRSFVEPGPIYNSALQASYYFGPFSGMLLLFAAKVRVLDTQLSGFGNGGGGWGQSIKSIVLWSFVLGSYYSVFGLITSFANDLYRALNGFAGIDIILEEMGNFRQVIRDKAAAESELSMWSFDYWKILGESVAAVPGQLIGLVLYHVSLLFVFVIVAFLRQAHAVLFACTFLLGLIVIPLNIAERISLWQGWKSLAYFVFLYPIIEAIALTFASLPFKGALASMIANSNDAAAWDGVNFLMIMTVFHGVLVLMEITVLVVTYILVSNAGDPKAWVTPFMNIIGKVRRGR
jgi:hypothetical protein